MAAFWISLIIMVTLLTLFKAYMTRGVKHAVRKKAVTWAYGIFSIGSLLLGILTMIFAFREGIIGMKFWQNFTIALMCSVIICETIVLIFFVADDVLMFGGWIKRKLTKEKAAHTPDPSRRRFVKLGGFSLMSLPFASFLYGITRGKYNFKVIEQELAYADLPDAFDGFRFVQFSDLHTGGFDSMEDVVRGLNLIQEQKPELILFTGDLVNSRSAEVLPYKDLLKKLAAPMGKFSVLGNHDYPHNSEEFRDKEEGKRNFAEIQQYHADMGFQLLNNANVKLEKNGEHIRLIGVENWGKGFVQEGDLDLAVEGCDDKEFSILMSHDPTHWEEKVLKHPKHFHLTLSGHTHGMQMGIEMMGIKWSPVQYLYERWAGLYEELNQKLYVNRGFGFMAFAGRVGVPPEITVFTLKKA